MTRTDHSRRLSAAKAGVLATLAFVAGAALSMLCFNSPQNHDASSEVLEAEVTRLRQDLQKLREDRAQNRTATSEAHPTRNAVAASGGSGFGSGPGSGRDSLTTLSPNSRDATAPRGLPSFSPAASPNDAPPHTALQRLQLAVDDDERRRLARELVAHPDLNTSLRASMVLLGLAPDEGMEAAEKLMDRPGGDAPHLRTQLLANLRTIPGERSLGMLRRIFDEARGSTRRGAARALEEKGEPFAMQTYIRESSAALLPNDATTRIETLHLLRGTGSDTILPLLNSGLQDHDPQVRLAALQAFAAVADKGDSWQIEEMRLDSDPAVRKQAGTILNQLRRR